jgi:GTPase KRas protein
MSDKKEYKLVVMGGGGVGKSALTIRLVSGKFEKTYDPTIEDSYRKDAIIDGEDCVLDVLDTAGQEEFAALRDQWIRESKGFILVYSVVKHGTLGELSQFYTQIERIKEDELNEIGIVLAGNKCDMEEQREVSKAEGLALAKDWATKGIRTSFYETSAKAEINNEEIYYEAVRLLCGRGTPVGGPLKTTTTTTTTGVNQGCSCTIV